ncbi:response regulator transcription factor [Raineyella sp. LH-20]|uniref:response regulator transcription factor n=1 Tax=Raineyella sp. LH-20 TaxID=3081204 RepID=UPI0029536FF4|nr:response regulator transcription factor [Raineyella sp. LH-20]WOP17792.1 response regulator transcription factor [Raineyella sp. LH-20]
MAHTEGDIRPIRVMVVDDDPMARSAIRAIVEADQGLIVVAEASEGGEVIDRVHAHHPDVVLMDLHLPTVNGVAVTARLLRGVNPPKVIALTSVDLDRYVFDALEAGASGFLLKDVAPKDLQQAIRTVHAGESVLSPRSTSHVIRHFVDVAHREQNLEAARGVARLTARELEVALLVHEDLSNDEIARRLCCSAATVKTHLSHAMAKLDASTRLQVALLIERAAPMTPVLGAGRMG